MRNIFCLLLLFLALSSSGAQDEAESVLSRALAAQQQGDDREAAALYEELLNSGYHSTHLYYNLGLAYYGAGRRGQAIWAWERGLHRSPGDADLRHNLSVVRQELADDIPEVSPWRMLHWWQRAGSWLGTNGWLLVFAGGMLLSGAALAAWLWPRRRSWQAYGRTVAIVVFLLSFLPLLLALSRHRHLQRHDSAILLTPETALRVAPGEDAPVEATVHEGLKVRLIDTFQGWQKVELGDGRQGWLREEELAVI